MSVALRWLSALLLAGVLAACGGSSPPPETFPKLTYANLAPYRLAVNGVDLVDATHPSAAAPHVEQNFPVSPSGAALQWARDRLVAVGGSARGVYTVLQADAIQTPLAVDSSSMFSDFNNPQSARYDLTIAVRLQIVEPGGRVAATVDAKATRSTTVAEDIKPNDLQRTWYILTGQTMADLNATLEKSIPQYLQSYLR